VTSQVVPVPAVAVLGLGSIGLRHAKNLHDLGADVAGFDPDPSRRRMAEDLGVYSSGDMAQVVNGRSAVVIASPSSAHEGDLRYAVESQLHAFVEKPIGHRIDNLRALIRRAEAGRLVVFAGLNLRYHPCVTRAKQAIEYGLLGDVLWGRFICSSFLPSWRPEANYRNGYAADPETGGAIFDHIHEFDLAMHLLGPAHCVACIATCTGQLEIESEVCADAILRHQNGAATSIHVDFATRAGMRRCEIAGTKGTLSADLRERTYELRGVDNEVLDRYSDTDTVAQDYVAEMASFLECLGGRDRPRCDGAEALMVLEQVVAARRLAGLPQA